MLEYIVRPFQSRPGGAFIPSTPRDTREKATLTWGAKANIPNDTVGGTGLNVNCCYEQYREAHRDNKVVKVSGSYLDSRGMVGPIGASYEMNSYIARSTRVVLQKDKQKTCSGDDWLQMSGAASAVEEAFADLAADLHVGSIDDAGPCKVIWSLNT